MKPKILSILPEKEESSNGHSDLSNHPLFKQSIPTDKLELSKRKETDLVDFNKAAERQFCELLCWLLSDGELSPKEAVQEAAFEINISPKTAQRYLFKHTARRAQFRIDENGLLRCKIHKH